MAQVAWLHASSASLPHPSLKVTVPAKSLTSPCSRLLTLWKEQYEAKHAAEDARISARELALLRVDGSGVEPSAPIASALRAADASGEHHLFVEPSFASLTTLRRRAAKRARLGMPELALRDALRLQFRWVRAGARVDEQPGATMLRELCQRPGAWQPPAHASREGSFLRRGLPMPIRGVAKECPPAIAAALAEPLDEELARAERARAEASATTPARYAPRFVARGDAGAVPRVDGATDTGDAALRAALAAGVPIVAARAGLVAEPVLERWRSPAYLEAQLPRECCVLRATAENKCAT